MNKNEELKELDQEQNTARVVEEHKTNYVLRTSRADFVGTVRGKFHIDEDFPKVGDFVRFTKTVEGVAVIEEILPRKTVIARDIQERSRNTGIQRSQILATNVDIAFIVMGLDGDFNLVRLERYLMLGSQSGITPVIILNKADIVLDKNKYEEEVKSVAGNTPIHFISALTGVGMDIFLKYLKKDITAVLIGSSGAGKSTITNWLLNRKAQSVGEVRKDDSRGKHTTTSRELFDLPLGAHLIDTPGIRGLGILAGATPDENVFSDIEELALKCRFADCDHHKSKGCAIQQAIRMNELESKHFKNYLKIKKEKDYQEAKTNKTTYLKHKNKVRKIHKDYKKIQNEKYRDRGFK